MKYLISLICVFFICLMNCNNKESNSTETFPTQSKSYKILALGDSYTIGESVCETCRFPEQLKESLKSNIEASDSIYLKVIAQTGWTTTNLIDAISEENPARDYDLVTLLIGVNNQYQHKPFSNYEMEFSQLVTKAIAFAKGEKNDVIVVSIPDYAFTPFGQGTSYPETISSELEQYNAFAKNYCDTNGITFVNITDITRLGIEQPELVASDGLHPSKIAYSKFVERIIPKALEKIK